MSRRIRSVAVVTAILLASTTAVVSAAPPAERPGPPSAADGADIQPRDLVIDERGLAYLRRASGAMVPYGHSIAAEKRPVEPRAPGGRPGRPGSGGSTDDGTVTFGQWEGGQVTTSAGRILFEMADGWYVCSGTAVTDETQDRSVVLTAAHCIYDDVGKAFAKQALFIPNQDDGGPDATDWDCSNDLFGCWVLDHGVVDVNWTTRTFPDNIAWDYGFYVVSDVGARSQASGYQQTDDGALDDVVGTLSIDFTSAGLGAAAHALGYSYDVDPEFMYCTEPLATEQTYDGYWLGQCGMSGGASGGPWVQPMDETTGAGPVFSVNSWGYSFQPGMGGPVLAESSADQLFAEAKSSILNGIGKIVDPNDTVANTPPTASFTSDCADLTCNFDGSGSTGSNLVYAWTFGDGGTSSAATTTHTYAGDGTYAVTLTVTDGSSTDSTTTDVSVADSEEPATNELTPSSTNQGKTWTAMVEGATSGTWDYPTPGSAATCTDTTCTLSGIAKKQASVMFVAGDGEAVTVAKP